MKKLKLNESGRSMVEMLGVLAVIGVLSIAGIAGYTTAMNSYHANETVNQARLLASIVSTQRLLNANGGDLSNDDLKGKFTFDKDTTNEIKLTATGLDPKVKDRITAMDLKIASVAEGENGGLVFTFKNDMSDVRDETSSTTPSEYTECTTNADCSGGRVCDPYRGICYCNAWESVWNGTSCVQNDQTECTPGYYKCALNIGYGWGITKCDSDGHWGEETNNYYNCTCVDYLPHPTMEEAATGCEQV